MSTATKQIRAVPSHENGKGSTVVEQETAPRWLPSFLAKALPSNWEHVVANKQIDSITMPKWIAVAILGAMLTLGVGGWWRASSDRDTLIEIRTELRIAKENRQEKDEALANALRDLNSWKEVMNGNMKKMEGMLSQQQLDQLDRYRKPRNGSQQ